MCSQSDGLASCAHLFVQMDGDHLEETAKKMEQYENNYEDYEDDFL